MVTGLILIFIGCFGLCLAFGFAREYETSKDLAISACWAAVLWAGCMFALACKIMA